MQDTRTLTPVRVTIDAFMDRPVFDAVHDPRSRWNGWVCPAFERSEAEKVVEWINANDDPDDANGVSARWDDDVVLVYERPYPDPIRYAPDDEGRYWIGAWTWTWSEITGD